MSSQSCIVAPVSKFQRFFCPFYILLEGTFSFRKVVIHVRPFCVSALCEL